MATDHPDNEASGRDPLEPEQLATPPEPPEPERRPEPRAAAPQPAATPLREPVRLRETSVRRIDHKGETVGEAGSVEPVEPAATLGDTLANERRRQGKSLADVEAATRIRGRLIESLEHGDYDALPSTAYVKGYVQSYADFLEIPAGPLIAQLTAETSARAAKADQHPYIKTPVPMEPRLKRRTGAGGSKDLPGPTGRWWVWVLLLVVVITAVIGVARLLASSDTKVQPLPNPSDKGVATSTPSANATGSAAATGAAAASGVVTEAPKPKPKAPVAPAGKFVVVVSVAGGKQSYLRISVDGSTQVDETMRGPQTKKYTASDRVTVVVGRPSAVSITKNGQPVAIPESTGNAVTVRITKV